MQIALASQLFSLTGAVLLRHLHEDSDLRSWSRRVSRVATLDGGAHFNDTGFTHADRTLRVVMSSSDLTQEQDAALRVLLRDYALITVVTEEGAFSAAPEGFSDAGGSISFNLLVKEALS
jgi:hypothetical protein